MNDWIPAIITITINVIAIAFAFGKLSQNVTNLKDRLTVSDDAVIRKNGKDDRWKERMEDKTHAMLPDCIEAFKEIRKTLNQLAGNVDVLLNRQPHDP